MGIIMSSRRSILAPVSRRSKVGLESKAGGTTPHQPAQTTQPEIETATKIKKPPGVGMFGSWFEESGDYDEEEDSKSWEQPWALPPTPLSPTFSSRTPSPTPITPKRNDRDEQQQGEKSQADKPKPSQARDAAPGTTKQDRKGKTRKGQKQPKTSSKIPLQALTPSPSVSPTSVASLTPTDKLEARTRSKLPTNLFSLSLEVRDKIYGYLLSAVTPVPVLRGWTQCYIRYRGGLEPAILCVCRQTYAEGIRILYSNNTFMYLIRDAGSPVPEALNPQGYISPMALSLGPPPLSELKNGTKGRTRKRQKTAKPLAKKSTVGDVNRIIYLAKYAHLFRRVEIVLESNRDTKQYGLAMAKAIQLLGNGEGGFRTNLTSLQLSITPVQVDKPGGTTEWTVVKFFTSSRNTPADAQSGGDSKRAKPSKTQDNHLVMDALGQLTVRLLHLTVYTPSSRRLDMTLDMTHRTSPDALGRLLAHDNLVAQQRAETATASAEAFDNLGLLIERACADTDKAVADGWWTEYGPPQVAAVRSAMEGIETIKGRMKKYRSPWYEKMRNEYAAQPEHALCVRKVGRRLLPSAD